MSSTGGMLCILGCVILALAANWPLAQCTKCSYACQQRYTTSCGVWGAFRCTRHRDITCYRCCTGWTGSTSTGCSTPICSPSCPNGGQCTSPDFCSNCNRGYYSPRCDHCTRISNCLAEFCSDSDDQKCDTCDGDYGDASGSAYKKSDDQRQCIKQCSWRTDSNACYPGACTNAQCACSPGFSGTDCRTLGTSQAPVLSEHRATLILWESTLESPRVQGSTGTVYTNIRSYTRLKTNWVSFYQPTGLPAPSAPYIQGVRLGIVAAEVSANVYRGNFTTYFLGTHPCSTSNTGIAFSRDAPVSDLVSCEHTFALDYTAWTPRTGDELRYNVRTTNGGYLKLYNRDSSSSIITRYYVGRTTSRSAMFTFDFDDPYHCLGESGGCRTAMLDAGGNVATQAELIVQWDGWADNLAGIKEYHLQVRQLSGSHCDEMTEIFDCPAVFDGVTHSGQNATLPHIGVYSVVLSVVDNAGNARHSRRFVLFDDDPNDVTAHGDSPVRVLSATAETGHVWQTDLDLTGGTTAVQLDWQGHFENVLHYNQGLLKPIGSYVSCSGYIDDDYDQYFGQRGRAGILNALGVTKFLVWHDVDHEGGRTVANASDDRSDNWSDEGTSTRATYRLSLVDGDSVRFWLEARDIAGHSLRDSVLVHADASPPVIEDFWLVRDGEVNLTFHNSEELQNITVAFKTYDIHSGVRTIEWRLYDNHTGSVVEIGRQTVPARKINTADEECDPVTCMCVPIGDCYAIDYDFHPNFHVGVHDYDYCITLTVTNHARLVTTHTIQITVDTSPPQAGTVHDGMRGSDEVDYQEGNDLSAHWAGFVDKESGVMFYEYRFDVSCLSDDIRNKNMTRTTSTHASWTAPSPGQYYITVVAYNGAFEPSEPVCSDGVDALPVNNGT